MKGWFCPIHGFVGSENDIISHRNLLNCSCTLRKIEREELSFYFNLFKNLLENQSLDIVDYANIRDKFLFEVLDIMEKGDREKAIDFVYFFEWLSGSIEIFDMSKKLPDEFPLKFYYSLFFTLANILSLKFEIGTIEGEMIKREEFEKSFYVTKFKLR